MEPRTQRLNALLQDHSSFIAHRLASFVGRSQELIEIQQRIDHLWETGGYVTVTGQAGQGKSSVLAKLLQSYGPEQTAHHFIPLRPGPDHQVGLLRNLLARLILKHDLAEVYVASSSRPALRDYFAQALREIAAKGQRELILIDGLDQIEADVNGERDLSFLPIEPPPGIVFLLGTRPDDTLRPLELRKPHTAYRLPNLTRADFDQILAARTVGISAQLADRFYQAMGENALYLDLLASELRAHDALEPEALIQRIAANPEQLFSLSLERVRRDQARWETVTRPILGLLLAARDPLSAQALQALLQISTDDCRDGLERLGGLLARDGLGRYYLYHLKLRDYLRLDGENGIGVPIPEEAGGVLRLDAENDARLSTAEEMDDHQNRESEPRLGFTAREEAAYHQQLAMWGLGDQTDAELALLWQPSQADALEQERRHYAQQHAIPHLAAARSYPQLWELIDMGSYGRSKLRHDPSGRSFILDLDIVRDAVIASANRIPAEEVAILPRLWRYSLLRCHISSQADNLPDQIFPLMAQLGDEQQAIQLAEVLSDAKRKVRVLASIALQLHQQADQQATAQQVLARAQQLARNQSTPDKQIILLIEVAQAAHTMQDLALVTQICAEVIQLAPGTTRHSAQVTALCALAAFQASFDPAAAKQTLQLARNAADAIAPPADQAKSLISIAETLIAAGAIDTALDTLQTAQFSGAKIEKEYIRAEQLSHSSSVLAQAGAFDLAYKIAKSIHTEAHHQARALTAIARARASTGARDLALTLLEEAGIIAHTIENGHLRNLALKQISNVFLQTEDFDLALTTLDALNERYARDNTLQAIAATFARAGNFGLAHSNADAITISHIHVEALCQIAEAQLQAGQLDAALETLEAACSHSNTIDMPYPQATQRKQIVRTYLQAGAFDLACATADSIKESEHRAQALSAIAQAYAQSGKFTLARVALQTAYLTAITTEDPSIRTQGLGKIAQSLAQLHAFDLALISAKLLKDPAEEIKIQCFIAHILLKDGQIKQAETRFLDAYALANTIEESAPRARNIKYIIEALNRAGLLDLALELASVLDEARTDPWLLHNSMRNFIERGDFDQAYRAALQISNLRSRTEALCVLLGDLVKSGAVAQAQQTLQQAQATADAIEDQFNQVWGLIGIVEGFALLGQIERAEALLQRVIALSSSIENRPAHLDNAFIRMARQLSKAGAYQLSHRAIAVLQDQTEQVELMVEMVEQMAQAGAFELARATADGISDLFERARSLNVIAAAQAQAGLRSQAEASLQALYALADTMSKTSDRVWSFSNTVIKLIKAGAFELAEQAIELMYATIDSITDLQIRTNMLSGIARELAEVKAVDLAFNVIQQAIMRAEQVSYLTERADSYERIAEVLILIGANNQAHRMLEQALAAANMIEHVEERTENICVISEYYAQLGDFELAHSCAAQIEDRKARTDTLRLIGKTMVQAGKFELALNTLQQAINTAESLPYERDDMMHELAVELKTIDQPGQNLLRALTLRAWRAADTDTYLFGISNLLPGELILESRFAESLGPAMEWVQAQLRQV